MELAYGLTSSWPAGALLDPRITTPFILDLRAGLTLPSRAISDLSATFPPAELRVGEFTPQYLPGLETGESRPCIEMGLAGSGSARGA